MPRCSTSTVQSTKQGQQRDAASRIGWSDSDERSPQGRAYAHGDSLGIPRRIDGPITRSTLSEPCSPLGEATLWVKEEGRAGERDVRPSTSDSTPPAAFLYFRVYHPRRSHPRKRSVSGASRSCASARSTSGPSRRRMHAPRKLPPSRSSGSTKNSASGWRCGRRSRGLCHGQSRLHLCRRGHRHRRNIRLWREVPRPGDYVGAYTTEQLEQMNRNFTAAVDRAFRAGDESEMAATATYDVRRPR